MKGKRVQTRLREGVASRRAGHSGLRAFEIADINDHGTTGEPSMLGADASWALGVVGARAGSGKEGLSTASSAQLRVAGQEKQSGQRETFNGKYRQGQVEAR